MSWWKAVGPRRLEEARQPGGGHEEGDEGERSDEEPEADRGPRSFQHSQYQQRAENDLEPGDWVHALPPLGELRRVGDDVEGWCQGGNDLESIDDGAPVPGSVNVRRKEEER
jgi:hypothetical protein